MIDKRSDLKLSIVATLYRSSDTIVEFTRRCFTAAEALFKDIEIVLVNDGSPDDSLQKALMLYESDPRIAIVDLSRNFGHHRAIMTGLAEATGELIFLIDSDLEEDPEFITPFFERMQQTGTDVVFGVQATRKGSLFERVSGEAFFWLANSLSNQKLPPNSITARLMTRDYVNALVEHRQRELTLGHLFVMVGFSQTPYVVTKHSNSPTTYSLARRVDMAVRYISTNSDKLLYIILFIGIAVSGISAIAIVYLIVHYLMSRVSVDGWTSVIVSVWFFGGLISLILGIFGMYVANILSESRSSPYTIVRRIHRRSK